MGFLAVNLTEPRAQVLAQHASGVVAFAVEKAFAQALSLKVTYQTLGDFQCIRIVSTNGDCHVVTILEKREQAPHPPLRVASFGRGSQGLGRGPGVIFSHSAHSPIESRRTQPR